MPARSLIDPSATLFAAAAPGWAGRAFPLKTRVGGRNTPLAPASAARRSSCNRDAMKLASVRLFRFQRPSAEALTWLVTAALLVVGSLLPGPDTGMLIALGRDLFALLPVIPVAAVLAGALTLGNWSDRTLAWLSDSPARAGVVASFVGAVTPVCGLGVLPLIATLLRRGLPLPPIMAF